MRYQVRDEPFDHIRRRALANALGRLMERGMLPAISGAADLAIQQKGVLQKATGTSFTLLIGTGGPTGLTTTPTNGDLIVYVCMANQNSATTINAPTYNAGTAGTWTAIGDQTNTGHGEVKAWWNTIHTDNIVSGAVTINQTISVSRTVILGAILFANYDTSTPISASAIGLSSGSSRNPHISAVQTATVAGKDCLVMLQYVKGGETSTQDTTAGNFNPALAGWSFDEAHNTTTGAAQGSGVIQTSVLASSVSNAKASSSSVTNQFDVSIIFAVKNAGGAGGPPGAPGAITYASIGTGGFTANFSAATAGTNAIDHYNVYLQDVDNSGSFVLQGSTVAAGGPYTYVFTGLLPNWHYIVKIEAVDSVGTAGTQTTGASVKTNKGANKTLVIPAGTAPRITTATGAGSAGTPTVKPGPAPPIIIGAGVAPRIARLTGLGAAGTPKVIQQIQGAGGVAPRMHAGIPTVKRWPAGARFGVSTISTVAASTDMLTQSYGSRDGGVHFTAATLTLGSASAPSPRKFTRCVFEGQVTVVGTAGQHIVFEDCVFLYSGTAGPALTITGAGDAQVTYSSGVGFKAGGLSIDTTGTVLVFFVAEHPDAPAPPGPPTPKVIVGAGGVAPRIARLTGLGSAGTPVAVKPGPVKVVVGAGVAPRITRLTGLGAAGTPTVVPHDPPSGLNAPLTMIPPWTSADIAADPVNYRKHAPNWKRLFFDVENTEHGWRPSLFASRLDVGYVDFTWDAAAGKFSPGPTKAGLHTYESLLVDPTHYGKFPGSLGSGTTFFTDPLLSEILGTSVTYDVSGWAYLRNIKFAGRFAPSTALSGAARPRYLVYNVECDNLAVRIRPADLPTFWLASDPNSGYFNPVGFRGIHRSIKLNYPGNGANAIQCSNFAGSFCGVTVNGYMQDNVTCGNGTADNWFAKGSCIINPAIRAEIDATPLNGAVWMNKGFKPNSEMFLQERATSQENTAIEVLGQVTTGTAQAFSIDRFTTTNEVWHDGGGGGGGAQTTITTRHFRVFLETLANGTVVTTASVFKANLEADSEINARISIQHTGVSDGSGLMSPWTDTHERDGVASSPYHGRPDSGDRFQVPSNANGILPHSDHAQIGRWKQTGFVPPMLPDGTLAAEPAAGGHSTDRFVTDPFYPGELGSCWYHWLSMESNHSFLFLQPAAKNGGTKAWPTEASEHIVMDRCRSHGYNGWINDGDSIGSGGVRCHIAAQDYPNVPGYFDSLLDREGPEIKAPPAVPPPLKSGSGSGPLTTDPLRNTRHVNPLGSRANYYADASVPIETDAEMLA